MFSFFSTPEEIIQTILSYLDSKDLVSVANVCRELKRLSLDNLIWQSLLKKNYHIDAANDCLEIYIACTLFEKGKAAFKVAYTEEAKINANRYFFQVLALLVKLQKYEGDTGPQHWMSCIKGEMLCHGYGMDANIKAGVALILESAMAGNSNAMLLLARINFIDYLLPLKVRQFAISQTAFNATEGKKWLIKSHEAGNPDATIALAKLYYRGDQGLGFTQDIGLSIQLFECLANQGSGEAAYQLAKIYSELDSEVIETYLPKKSCEAENSSLETTDPRMDMMLFWIEKALKAGDRTAALEFPSMLKNYQWVACHFEDQSSLKTKINMTKVIACLKQAAVLNSSEAAYTLGCLYSVDSFISSNEDHPHLFKKGTFLGVQPNIEEAIKWFEQGIKGVGFPYTVFCAGVLAQFYISNEFGIQTDLNKVIYWYEQAAALGDQTAFLNLGQLFITGNDSLKLASNFKQAEEYFVKAFCQQDGRSDSSKALLIAEMYREMNTNGEYLGEYVKWNIRGVMASLNSQSDDCAKHLAAFFKRYAKAQNLALAQQWQEVSNAIQRDGRYPTTDEIKALTEKSFIAVGAPVIDDYVQQAVSPSLAMKM